MEQVKVSEIASEFTLQNSAVISELKKIGVWVPSPDTPVDHDIANRIRKRLQLLVELEHEEQVRAEKPQQKKKAAAPAQAEKRAKKPARLAKSAILEPRSAETPLAPSLKPRKGRAVYRTIEPVQEAAPERAEATIEQPTVVEKLEPTPLVETAELAEKVEIAEKPPPVEKLPLEEKPPAAEEKKIAEPFPPVRRLVEKKPHVTPVFAREGVKGTPDRPAVREPFKEKPKLLKKTAAQVTPVQAAQIARRLVKPAVPEEKPKKPVARLVSAAAPSPRREVPKVPEKREITEIRAVKLPEAVTLKELSGKLQVKSNDIFKELLARGIIATINQTLEQKLVEEICSTFGFIPQFVSFEEALMEEDHVVDRLEDVVTRAPVVTVMGHVDHGKTSLLDAIRETKVAAGEAGGITQHIGAYHVNVQRRKIVFLDTPGHEAFTLMRARGAQVTDIVVLVVAADDGVMPQTIEAIHHARAAKVPILVAINKIDKPEAQPQRVKQQLTEYGLVAEDWGGETVMVQVSAKEKTNLDLLLEMILLVADLLELKSNPKRPASGVVLEAKLDKGRGVVATLLVRNGTLRVGDSFIAGAVYGRVRALFDDRGNPVTEAGPSSAVEIFGLQGTPQAGDSFQAIDDTVKARLIGEYRQQKLRQKDLAKSSRISLDQLYTHLQQAAEIKELPMVLKADVQGSAEVVQDMLQKLSTDKVRIRIIHCGIGAISESDVLLASASNAVVVGFNVRPERSAQELAEHEGVDVRLYTVIYDVSDEIRKAMLGLLEPTFLETYLGKAEVRNTFRIPKVGSVAGSYVLDGVITRNAEVRLLRDNVVIYEGRVNSLRRFKDDVPEVKGGYECGITLANFSDIKIRDVIEAFVKEKVEPRLA